MDSATTTVRVWWVGQGFVIEVPPDADDQEFAEVIDHLGLKGRTDFRVAYDHLTGTEYITLPG